MLNVRLADIINSTRRLESEYSENYESELAVTSYDDSDYDLRELDEIFNK